MVDRHIPFLQGVLEPWGDVAYCDGESITATDVHSADALLVRTRTRCDAKLLQGSSVRFVGTATIGTDHLDIPWLDSQNISWSSAPGSNAMGVVQYVVASLLAISVKHGIPLEGQTLGIVGCGQVGGRLARIARILGMRVLCNDPMRAEREGRSGFVGIHTIQREADFISLHTPLVQDGTYATWRLVNGSFLTRLKPNCWLINTSRGSVVDNTALRIALRSNSLAGAVLDVWENEPNAIDDSLLELVEIGTPHIAGYSMEGKANATTQILNAMGHALGIPALQSWSVPVQELEVQPSRILSISEQSPFDEPLLWEAVRQCYDIFADDQALRKNPASFESLRQDYKYRREFTAHQVQLPNPSLSLVTKLKGLGFRLV